MLTVFLQIFSEDTVILAEVVRLKELPASMGPESAMDYIRRAVCDILCAGDAFLDSRSPRARGSVRWWEVIVKVYQAFFALTVSKKTETIIRSMPPPRIPRTMRRESRSGQANLRTGFMLHILPEGRRYRNPGNSTEITRQTRACWMRTIRRNMHELYDELKVALSLKARME